MFIDAQELFSDAQTVTTGSENGVASSNLIDLGVARDLGAGRDVYLVVQVDTALTGAGDTCLVVLQTDDNADFNSPTTLQTIGTFSANSAAGSRLVAKLQPSSSWERYIRLLYTANGSGALETGAFTAFLTTDVDSLRKYAKGWTIS